MAKKILAGVCIGLALIMVFSTVNARAECCYYVNPLFLPFAAAGLVLGTAAAIATAPFTYPAYYGPAPHYYAPAPAYHGPGPAYYGPGPYRAWVRGHYDRDGYWMPGHWR
jgi:hypothetical protein